MARVPLEQEKAFLKAYDELSDALFKHSYFRVSEREIARDLVQETFLKVWDYLARGEEIRNIRAFLYQVINNLIIDYYRKKKTDSLDVLAEDENFDPPEDSHEATWQMAEVSVVKEKLESLPNEYRQIMVLRYVDGFSVKEIAELLRETENVVSVRIHRATKKLKDILSI